MEVKDANITFLEKQNKLQKEEILQLRKQLGNIHLSNGKPLSGVNNSAPNQLELSAAVFSNHIILANILKHLDIPGLKTARLVCSLWSEIAISQSKFRLNVIKLFPCCTIASLPPLCPGLAKFIYFHNHCPGLEDDDHEDERPSEAAANNFLAFCSQYHEFVEDIFLQVDMLFSTPFVEALGSMGFPNLGKIRVLLSDENIDFPGDIAPFPERPGLLQLDVETNNPSPEDYPFLEIFQKLIQSAPNLEKLSIEDNFFPDLSTTSRLQVLELSPTPYENTYSDFNYDDDVPSEEETFRMAEITRMLQQRKDSLQKLVISSQSPHLHEDGHLHSQARQFHLPKSMPRLEEIVNYAVELFPLLGDVNRGLTPAGYPMLKKLTLRECRNPKGVETLLENFSTRNHVFQSVIGLDLCDVRNPQALPVSAFPNVKECFIQLPRLGEDDARDKKELFQRLFETVSKWPLQTFGVQIEFRYRWSELVDALEQLKPAGNGLEILKIQNTDSYGVQDDFQLKYENQENYVGKLEEILQQSNGMRRMVFQSFSIKTATAVRIIKFINDNNLPVYFPE